MKILTRLLLPLIAILFLFAWYKFSVLPGAISETASVMETVPSFGQNQPTQSPSSSMPEITPTIVEPLPNIPKEEVVPIVPIVYDVLNNGDLSELVIDSIGMFLYVGLALIGVLMMLRYSSLNKAWTILCVGILFISFIPPLFGFSILKERWWFLSQAFLAIPLAVCLVGLLGANKKVFRSIIVTCLASIVVIFSVIGLPANITNRVLSPNLIMRYGLTDNEMEGLKIVEDRYADKYGLLGSDSFYISYIQSDVKWYYPKRTKVASLDENIMNGDFRTCKCNILLLREATYKEPYGFGNGAIYKVEYNPIEVAKNQGYSEVWSNGEITCLVRK